jgi:hypothetical protein
MIPGCQSASKRSSSRIAVTTPSRRFPLVAHDGDQGTVRLSHQRGDLQGGVLIADDRQRGPVLRQQIGALAAARASSSNRTAGYSITRSRARTPRR